MVFGFEIERKNYILFVGWPPEWKETVFYIFDGWTNSAQKERFFSSVEFLRQEACAGRITPNLRDELSLLIYTPNEIKGVGTPIGGMLKVQYNKHKTKYGQIENFFKESGIAVHRADPFYKPIKTLWQIIKGLV